MSGNNKTFATLPAFIVVADDDPMIQEVLRSKLGKEGFQVEIVGDGEEALAAIARRLPDLLILDVKMPKLDGHEVCRRLRSEEKTLTLPILMLTAYGGVEHVIKGLEAGADDYVSKPFHLEEVMMRMRGLLRLRQMERTLRENERRWTRMETVQQLLVTLAHYINNSLAIIEGRAQTLKSTDAETLKFRDVCLRQSQRLSIVLESLHSLADQMTLETVAYAGTTIAMLDLEAEITRRLKEQEN